MRTMSISAIDFRRCWTSSGSRSWHFAIGRARTEMRNIYLKYIFSILGFHNGNCGAKRGQRFTVGGTFQKSRTTITRDNLLTRRYE